MITSFGDQTESECPWKVSKDVTFVSSGVTVEMGTIPMLPCSRHYASRDDWTIAALVIWGLKTLCADSIALHPFNLDFISTTDTGWCPTFLFTWLSGTSVLVRADWDILELSENDQVMFGLPAHGSYSIWLLIRDQLESSFKKIHMFIYFSYTFSTLSIAHRKNQS